MRYIRENPLKMEEMISNRHATLNTLKYENLVNEYGKLLKNILKYVKLIKLFKKTEYINILYGIRNLRGLKMTYNRDCCYEKS